MNIIYTLVYILFIIYKYIYTVKELTINKVFIWPAAFLSTLEEFGPSKHTSIRSETNLILGITNAFITSGPNSQRPWIAPYNEASGV